MMTGQFPLMLRWVLIDHHPLLNPGGTSTMVLVVLVMLMIMTLFFLAAPALPRLFRGLTGPSALPPSTTRVFTWLSWLMLVVSALVVGSEVRDFPPLWPLALFSVAGLVFAILCTRAHRRERARILAEATKGADRC